jgi:hypothetical protein
MNDNYCSAMYYQNHVARPLYIMLTANPATSRRRQFREIYLYDCTPHNQSSN